MSLACTTRNWRSLAPPLALTACVLALTLARFLQHWQLPLPQCGLRTLTGLPCPTCGGTRSFLALSELDLSRAFHFNPLVTVAALALCGWTALWLLDLCCHRSWAECMARKTQQSLWPWPLAVATALNWVYLLLCLPR